MSLAQERSVEVAEAAPTGTASVAARYARQAWPTVREFLLVAALFMVYKLGRVLIDGHAARAMTTAWDVWDIERALRLPSEVAVQKMIIGHHGIVRSANYYYAGVHFPATAICLIWMYLRRPAHYRWIRWVLACVTAAALALHMLMPLAPPRMLAGIGIVDTAAVFGPAVYGSPSTDTLSNQYAAMPSLHVGWAVAVAVALVVSTRSRWRWLWLLHPLITLTVVVATGNHYWLDAVVAVVLLALAFLIVPWPRSAPVDLGSGRSTAATAATAATGATPSAGAASASLTRAVGASSGSARAVGASSGPSRTAGASSGPARATGASSGPVRGAGVGPNRVPAQRSAKVEFPTARE